MSRYSQPACDIEAAAFMTVFPDEMHAWYDYNAGLADPLFSLGRISRCRCLPRHSNHCPATIAGAVEGVGTSCAAWEWIDDESSRPRHMDPPRYHGSARLRSVRAVPIQTESIQLPQFAFESIFGSDSDSMGSESWSGFDVFNGVDGFFISTDDQLRMRRRSTVIDSWDSTIPTTDHSEVSLSTPRKASASANRSRNELPTSPTSPPPPAPPAPPSALMSAEDGVVRHASSLQSHHKRNVDNDRNSLDILASIASREFIDSTSSSSASSSSTGSSSSSTGQSIGGSLLSASMGDHKREKQHLSQQHQPVQVQREPLADLVLSSNAKRQRVALESTCLDTVVGDGSSEGTAPQRHRRTSLSGSWDSREASSSASEQRVRRRGELPRSPSPPPLTLPSTLLREETWERVGQQGDFLPRTARVRGGGNDFIDLTGDDATGDTDRDGRVLSEHSDNAAAGVRSDTSSSKRSRKGE